MSRLRLQDLLGTAVRHALEIKNLPAGERSAHSTHCAQVYRELALVQGIDPDNANKLASVMTEWTMEIVALGEDQDGGLPIELRLPPHLTEN